MEEIIGKDEGMATAIEIFLCYAHEDKAFLEKLEQHLAPLKRQGLVTSWHDGDIHAGATWEQEIHTHLNSAQLILLLISPGFMDSDYCYSVEMTRALERQRRGECRVIPVIVRAVYWQGEPLGNLQALPTGGKPIASWRDQDEAFLEVIEGIRPVIKEIKAPLPLSTLSHRPPENAETVEDASLTIDKPIFPPKNRNSRRRKLLVFLLILLILAATSIIFLPSSTCSFAVCRSSTQPTREPSPQSTGEAHDSNLSIELVTVLSPSFLLPDDYSEGTPPPTNVSAVLLPETPSSYDTLVLSVRNLRYGGVDTYIDSIALKLLSIPALPQPLKVWTPGVSTTYPGYPYTVTYTDQQPGKLVYAESSKPTILTPAGPGRSGETDILSLQVMSTATAYLRFQVEITYQITGPEHTLILPQIFSVVFSDASNWQEEHV